MRTLKFILEAIILYVFYGLCALLPPETASNLGGLIARTIGPRLSLSKRAREHLRESFPEKSESEIETLILEVWDNLGRILAEYPHLEKIALSRTTVRGDDIVKKIIADNKGGVFFGAHQGNWEINCPALLMQYHVAPRLTYRALNNPMADWLLEHARSLGGRIIVFPKARSSAKDLMAALKERNFIGILVDQKYNEGVEARFFGRPAMSNPIAIMLCQKYNVPLVPIRNVRTGPA